MNSENVKIQAKELIKSFPPDVSVLKGLDITLKAGDFYALMGPSGSGKSTLLNVLGALIPVTSGSLEINGRDITKLNRNKLTLIRRHEIGWVFQDFNLIANLTALENVLIPLHLDGKTGNEATERAMYLLKRVDLADRAHHLIDALSGGQQQRVAIARALANNPDIILADEPTGNLDSKSGKEIIDLFLELAAEGKAILMVTHDSALAHAAQKVYVLQKGKMIEELDGMEVEI